MRTRSTPQGLRGLKLPERYEIRRHIASGGMAAVWCAEDLVLSRTVAIKVLAERFAHDDLAVHRFMREARAAARVSSHAHVVTIYDVGETTVTDGERDADGDPEAGPAFIVMEYLAGGTVSDALKVGAIERPEALRWLTDAASALDHAHARGVVHRDIKPANFLLDQGRALYVADFGIARLLSEDTITNSGELFGTAGYLSPEQALGRSGTDASDRYSLAVAAFELLVGARPFTGEHFAAQARQHIDDPPPSASERNRTLPRAVDAVLARGMAKRPEDRHPTAGALVDELGTALGRGATRTRRAVPAAPAAAAAPAAPAAAAARAVAAPVRPAAGSAGTPMPRFSSPPSRRTGRATALAALLAAAVVIGLIAALSGGGAPSVKQTSAHRSAPRSGAKPARKPQPAASAGTPAASSTSSSSSSSTTSAQTTPAATPQSADGLEAQGHRLLLSGAYSTAVPTLRRAVAAAAPGSLLQGYALYDLGRSLLLSGDPAGAVPVLQQRLQINDQLPVVRKLLAAALAASGQGHGGPGPSGAGASAVSPGGHGGDHGKGGGKGK